MSTAEHLNAAFGGRYQIERELGAGGMATVFLARDLKHDRDVAIKVLRSDLSAVLGVERFLAEVRITARLDHPHILTLIDSGEADGILYYVLPVVRGESLRAKLQREKQLGIDDAIALIKQVASALDYAHAQGVVHRDIKPENILIHQGEAVLTDFGIALAVREAGGTRLTETGLSLGTPQYMSPEQATGDRALDARSDVYSLAAVLYEMLSGEPPVTGATAQAMIAKLLMEKPTSLRVMRDTVPAAVDEAIARGLSKVPADRFASAGEFVRALGRADDGAAGLERRRATPKVARSVWMIALLLVVAALGLWVATNRWARRIDISLGERTQVTFTGNALYTSISDDGKSVAYVVKECGATVCTYSLDVQDVGSRATRRILSGSLHQIRSIKWSPDRRSIFFEGDVAGEDASGLVSALGGPPVRIASATTNLDFYGSDSLLKADANATRDIQVAGLDGVPRDRIHVVDSAEKLIVYDAMFVPESRWFVALLCDATACTHLRVVDRAGRRASEIAISGAGLFLGEWASADAVWRLEAYAASVDRNVLLRYAVDSRSGRLSAVPDTVYRGTASFFDVTRDGKNVLLNEGSATFGYWAADANELFRGRLPAARELDSSTTVGLARISPDGQRVLVERSFAPRVDASVRPFGGGRAVPMPLGGTLGAIWTDSVTLMFAKSYGERLQLGRLDVTTGTVRDTLLLPPGVLADGMVGGAPTGAGGWIWKTRGTGPLMRQRGVGEPAQPVALPPGMGLVSNLAVVSGGRRVVVAGEVAAAPDSTQIVMIDLDGGPSTVWARVRGSVSAFIGGDSLTGFLQGPSVFALDGPGRVRLVGRSATPGTIFVSSDFKRATLTTRDYHGDAWLMKVVRK